MKNLKLLIIACIISSAAFAQNYPYSSFSKNRVFGSGYSFDTSKATPKQMELIHRRQRLLKNKAFDGHQLIDTTKATPKQMEAVHRAQKIQKLFESGYLQKRQNGKDYFKNRAFDGRMFVDTLIAALEEMDAVHKIQKVKQLARDHYYYDTLNVRNLGVTVKSNGSRRINVYEGLNWGLNNEFKSIIINGGQCAIEVAALDINEKNANEYTYRVIQNDTIDLVAAGTKPTVFRYTTDGKAKYAYLGLYFSGDNPSRELKIELYKNKQLVDAIIVGWNVVRPAALMFPSVSYYGTSPERVNKLLTRELNTTGRNERLIQVKTADGTLDLAESPSPKVRDFVETKSVNDIKLRADDSVQFLTFTIHNNSKLYNYKAVLYRDADDYTDSVMLGETNSQIILYKDFWKSPGKYKLTLIPVLYRYGGQPVAMSDKMASSFSFTIVPQLGIRHYVSIRTFIFILLVVLATALRIYFYMRRKQKIAAQSKEIAELQLKSVRSQLNPHFIFNALAGIQNLMNKNEVENANKYLARFARITRSVLDDGQKDLTTIEQEARLLKDYLEMEQMRFGFKFDIVVDKAVDQQIEIPAMLLQPFVENAVKHGISALKGDGFVKVKIGQRDNDIILFVGDNGPGFNKAQKPGMGIKLCEERIKLLNSIYKNSTILLDINSNDKGAVVTIELKNWL